MLTVKDFADNGYKQFKNNGVINSSDFGLQKRIDDEVGKRYFITVWVYDWSKYPEHNQPNKLSFAPDVQLRLQNDMHIDVQMLLNQDSTVQDIELFYHEMWEKFNCHYYEWFEK